MFCSACGCKMEEHDKFCPACGARNEDAAMTKIFQPEEPTREYAPDTTREYAPVDSGYAANAPIFEDEDNRTMVLDGYNSASYLQNEFAEPLNPRQPEYQDPYAQPQTQAPKSYQDSFYQQDQPRFGDSGWEDPYQPAAKPPRTTSAGRKAISILLCLLMLLFSFCALLIGSARIAFSENNVRKAYQKGALADLKITTEKGEQSLSQILMENVVDAQTNDLIPLEEKAVDSLLRSQSINNFAENLVVDFTQFFIFGRTPTLLNGKAVTDYLTSFSNEVKETINYSMSDDDIAYIGQRIDGGDLSFLSIDKDGGYFKQKYGFDPYTISSMFSVWALAICGGLALLCVIMIFVINHGNPRAAFSFNGTTMIIFGVINTLIAAGGLILSFIKPIFLVSELLRNFSYAMGGISIAVLLVGIVFSVIKTVFKNRI